MSTVVVVKKAGRVVIAADTLTSFGDTKCRGKYIENKDKILTFKDSYIGLVGSAAHSNVFYSIINNYANLLSFKSREDIFESYIKLHPILKEKYFLTTQEGDESEQVYESSQINALITNRYGIFGVFSWREVYDYERFWAVGSGSSFALGAMYAAYDLLSTPEEIAKVGVEAGAEFDNGSALPDSIYSVQLKVVEK
ncbi:MAG: 20S proteasome subunits A/B [bacterium]|nr:MAG: 20S proteasome subunits A/B [bacterium]